MDSRVLKQALYDLVRGAALRREPTPALQARLAGKGFSTQTARVVAEAAASRVHGPLPR
jgi:hypothetical protein